MRDATDVTSAAVVEVDLSTFIGCYVTLSWDQSVYFSFAPATGTFTLDSSASAIAAALTPASGALVPERVFSDSTSGIARASDVFVSSKFPRLLVRAVSTSTTYTEVKVTSVRMPGSAG